jgi:RNA polymerase sigma-70 factor (ECF subfamily)
MANTAPLTDRDLIERSREGDRAAFGLLVKRYQGAVYSLALGRLGDPTDAEDVAQEAFVKAYAALDRFDVRRKWAPWLFTIAVNLCKDRLKRRKFRAFSLDAMQEGRDGGVERELPDQGPGPDTQYLQRERQQRVLAAVNSLPSHYREAVVLRFTQDLSYDEIAQALHVPLTTVVGRLAKAKKLLRQKLGAYFSGGE